MENLFYFFYAAILFLAGLFSLASWRKGWEIILWGLLMLAISIWIFLENWEHWFPGLINN